MKLVYYTFDCPLQITRTNLQEFWHISTNSINQIYDKVAPLICYRNFSIRCRAEPVYEVAGWNRQQRLSKDGKIEAVHCLLEQRQTLSLLEIWRAARRGGKSRRHKTSVNSDVVLNAFCSRTADTTNRFLSDRKTFLPCFFHNVCTEVNKAVVPC